MSLTVYVCNVGKLTTIVKRFQEKEVMHQLLVYGEEQS